MHSARKIQSLSLLDSQESVLQSLEPDESVLVNVVMTSPDDESPIGLTLVQRFSQSGIGRSSIITSGVGR